MQPDPLPLCRSICHSFRATDDTVVISETYHRRLWPNVSIFVTGIGLLSRYSRFAFIVKLSLMQGFEVTLNIH
jgi:hypothetical protein